ncbi:MAG: hypothetical protein WCA32_12190 [Chromatiaceae bacterium]|jgi:hypothetical protein
MPQSRSTDYSDQDSLKRWLYEQGWAICDGSEGTPDLNYRLLLGTVHPADVGQNLGSRTHSHRITAETGIGFGREHSYISRRGVSRALEQGHRHKLDAGTAAADNLPLSTRVLFIMKIR